MEELGHRRVAGEVDWRAVGLKSNGRREGVAWEGKRGGRVEGG